MKLPDKSIWIDHLRGGEPALIKLLQSEDLLLHPFVVGELAVGQLPRRSDTLARLRLQLQAPVIESDDVLAFIEKHGLAANGFGYVDVPACFGQLDGKCEPLDARQTTACATRLSLAAEL